MELAILCFLVNFGLKEQIEWIGLVLELNLLIRFLCFGC